MKKASKRGGFELYYHANDYQLTAICFASIFTSSFL